MFTAIIYKDNKMNDKELYKRFKDDPDWCPDAKCGKCYLVRMSRKYKLPKHSNSEGGLDCTRYTTKKLIDKIDKYVEKDKMIEEILKDG
jgi:hypothetical protein